ncbi:EamA family transporter [Pedobacter antarcticus]|uniref:EamA family transporter n=1 Tax=Pedobacter antarcticus TaxID=34086 RepID=UPI000884612D|nr:EamA family transporter [Pedobacter antarcticus]SDM14892.1 O-acetylserine/cysteine efflux transporter [Pedobacter antarcticus]
MKPKHLLLAILTVVIWGLNFIAIHSGLKVLPPFLLCAIRFGLAALPWVFFIPKPKAKLKLILGYGIFTFAVQFGLLFTGIHLGLSPGLSSLVIQVQVFFSMGLAALLFKDRPSNWKIIGALISFVGVGLVATQVGGGSTLIGLILTLLSALSWAVGNMFTKKVAAESPLALVVWGNLVAFPIMMGISLFAEGPALIYSSYQEISLETILAIIYTVYLSTLVGYGAWGFLLNNYSTGVIVPFTLLVPVVGLLSSAFFLGEALPSWKLWACLFIILGLLFNLLEKQIRGVLLKASHS